MSLSFTSHITIAAPPEKVAAAMTDFAAWPQWMNGLVGVEELTEGPYGVGTRWRETRNMFGQEAAEVFEVTAFEPPHKIGLWVDGKQGTTGKGEYRFLYTLTPVEEGSTEVSMEADIDMPGLSAKIFGFLLKGMFKKACDRDTNALKAYLEADLEKTASAAVS